MPSKGRKFGELPLGLAVGAASVVARNSETNNKIEVYFECEMPWKGLVNVGVKKEIDHVTWKASRGFDELGSVWESSVPLKYLVISLAKALPFKI